MYTDDILSKSLNGYWELCEGMMPSELNDTAGQRGERAPFETPCVLKADIDMAVDMLAPGKWYDLCSGFERMQRADFEDNPKLIWRLSRRQQGIVRYHMLKESIECTNAMAARRIMLRFLNKGQNSKEILKGV